MNTVESDLRATLTALAQAFIGRRFGSLGINLRRGPAKPHPYVAGGWYGNLQATRYRYPHSSPLNNYYWITISISIYLSTTSFWV